MSCLVYDRFRAGLQFPQKIKITREYNIAHVRPWVYLQGDIQDGSFKVTVSDGATELATSEITATEINTAKTLQFFHGFIRFDFDSLALKIPEGVTEKEYTFTFEMINHSDDSANFVAMVRSWDYPIYTIYGDDVVDGEPPNDAVTPGGLELYERKPL